MEGLIRQRGAAPGNCASTPASTPTPADVATARQRCAATALVRSAAHAELHPPTPAELNTLLVHVATVDRMFHAFVLLAATTGARRAQLLGLRWENVRRDTI